MQQFLLLLKFGNDPNFDQLFVLVGGTTIIIYKYHPSPPFFLSGGPRRRPGCWLVGMLKMVYKIYSKDTQQNWCIYVHTHPKKLIWNFKRIPCTTENIFKLAILGFHASFCWGCILLSRNNYRPHS